jgi:hypothetical protein
MVRKREEHFLMNLNLNLNLLNKPSFEEGLENNGI